MRKGFAVAVHAGGAAALVCGQRHSIHAELCDFDRRRATVLALSFAPTVAAGFALERPIERRLGGPLATAVGLIAGAAAMALADLRPQERGRGDVQALDGLALGFAQATALVPGVSRNGATLAAARSRKFTRDQANFLSRTVALPVISAATALKASRMRRAGLDRRLGKAVFAGMASSFVSTLASQRLINVVERDRALWPYAAYRVGLAGAVLWKLRRQARGTAAANPGGSGALVGPAVVPATFPRRSARMTANGVPGRAPGVARKAADETVARTEPRAG